MKTRLIPYLNFGTECREAMTFYKECLGGKLSIMTVGESPVAKEMPNAPQDAVMHSSLVVNDSFTIYASDSMGQEELVPGNTVTLCLGCGSEEETNRFFTALSAGGEVLQPLGPAFWGGMFGMLKDKYGMRWMFDYEAEAAGDAGSAFA